MRLFQRIVGLSFFISSFIVSPVFAAHIVVTEGDISFSKAEPLVSESVRIYAVLANRGGDDVRGIVKFFDGSKQIGTDQPFSMLRGKTTDVFTDYPSLPYGNRTIVVKVMSWPDTKFSASASVSLFVDRDSDTDGIPDKKDPDDDNDGYLDDQDAFPLDPTEWIDTDKDGIGNNKDPDDDNDGISDEEEKIKGTNPLLWDTDGDGVNDKEDVFALDPTEWIDTDGDGIGNNKDPDDDNDGYGDSDDQLPLDPTEWIDTDGDGIGNKRDTDDDNDGLSDGEEIDRGTDPLMLDTDGDGINDKEDIFPLDSAEWLDTDHDGLGDNADPNNNNKGPQLIVNIPEMISLFWLYSFDASQTVDPDGTIETIYWMVDDKKIEKSQFSYVFFTPGKRVVRLIAIDDKGEKREGVYIYNISGLGYYIMVGIFFIIGVTYLRFFRKNKKKDKESLT